MFYLVLEGEFFGKLGLLSYVKVGLTVKGTSSRLGVHHRGLLRHSKIDNRRRRRLCKRSSDVSAQS